MITISNTFSITLAQRRRQIGLLRAVGATGGQVRRRFLLEAALLGVAGSLLGLSVGIGIAAVGDRVEHGAVLGAQPAAGPARDRAGPWRAGDGRRRVRPDPARNEGRPRSEALQPVLSGDERRGFRGARGALRPAAGGGAGGGCGRGRRQQSERPPDRDRGRSADLRRRPVRWATVRACAAEGLRAPVPLDRHRATAGRRQRRTQPTSRHGDRHRLDARCRPDGHPAGGHGQRPAHRARPDRRPLPGGPAGGLAVCRR